MEISTQYRTITNNMDCNIREYVTPALHTDPRKQILDRKNSDYKNKPKQKKFKPNCKHKPCFMDEHIKPFVPNPSPDKYKMKEGFVMDSKEKRAKSADLKKVDQNLKKRTYIDEIQEFQTKFKHPGVAKYDLTKQPFKDKHTNLRPKQLPRKFGHLDNFKTIADAVPGPGNHNPHDQVPHLKLNRTDYKFFKQKHERQQKKMKRAISTKLGPSTYKPVAANTFDEIALRKGKQRSRWSHGQITIHKGAVSKMKSPSPAQYHLLNQWEPRDGREKQSNLGKVKLYERITQSTKAFSVYH